MTARVCFLFLWMLFNATYVEAAPFFDPQLDARALALGHAYSAVVDDASAAYWNPARLALLPRTAYALAGLQLGSGGGLGQFPFAAAAYRVQGISAGAWWAQQQALSGALHRGLGISAAARLGVIQMGLGWKYLGLEQAGTVAGGAGLDLALMGDFLDMIAVGIVVQDAVQTRLRVGEQVHTALLPTTRISASFRLESFTFSAETVLQENELQALRFGAEVRLAGVLAFRLGKDDELWSWGVGLGVLDRLRVDVAQRIDGKNGDVWLVSAHVTL